ncbi:MAG: hypothetical protein ACN6ON_14580 [Sphingobacterium sp.]
METKFNIVSHEAISRNYLQLHIQSNGKPCGSVDFIAEKVNFNISYRWNFFKGMEAIKDIELQYSGGNLIFRFANKKSLVFGCTAEIYKTIRIYCALL